MIIGFMWYIINIMHFFLIISSFSFIGFLCCMFHFYEIIKLNTFFTIFERQSAWIYHIINLEGKASTMWLFKKFTSVNRKAKFRLHDQNSSGKNFQIRFPLITVSWSHLYIFYSCSYYPSLGKCWMIES
jgi:hypothetical protein